LPKTATSLAQNVTWNAGGVTFTDAASGTMGLDTKRGVTGNTESDPINDAMNRLANSFAHAGYTQVSP
jgi:hypothetical protein